jgi:2-phospho-L-lactate/phosphoenolpyruvate guanylyltransferase
VSGKERQALKAAAILPVKRFDQAKQRLANTLSADPRTALARAMLDDVLLALDAARSLETVIVVSSEPGVERSARRRKVTVLSDALEEGQSKAASAGIRVASTRGFARVLLVPGDCPLMDSVELERLVEKSVEQDLDAVIVPDRHGEGTNALLLHLPTVFEPEFGPGSLERHERQAERHGLRHLVEPVASLALDVDTPEDLAALASALGSSSYHAPSTRAALRKVLPQVRCEQR